eukprot:jgi/Astpho2/2636/Aster-x0112
MGTRKIRLQEDEEWQPSSATSTVQHAAGARPHTSRSRSPEEDQSMSDDEDFIVDELPASRRKRRTAGKASGAVADHRALARSLRHRHRELSSQPSLSGAAGSPSERPLLSSGRRESSEGGSGSLERTSSQPLAAQLSGLSGKSSLSSAAQLSARRGCNSGKSRSSRFKGVSRVKDKEGHCWKWRARISYDGGKHFLGYFDDERAAAEAYDCAAINLWGDEDAITNFAKDGSGSINAAAADSPVTKSSRHRGVYWDNNKQLWRAGIGSKGKQHFLGYFKEEDDAAATYDAAAMMFMGNHQLNFPDKSGSLVLTTDALDRVNKLADTTGHAHVSFPTVPGSPQGKPPYGLFSS